MMAGDCMKMDKVKCVQEGEGWELPSVFRVIVPAGWMNLEEDGGGQGGEPG